jgi:predicted TIM-barrel fold metal-dependent hydrolase
VIVVKNKETGFIERIVLVDGHTHTGAEGVIEYGENTKRKNNPKNILDFHTQLNFEILRYMKKESKDFLYEPINNLEWHLPLLDTYFAEVTGNRLTGNSCDHFATFPFSDINTYKESPYFHQPNDYILRRSRQKGYSLKVIPYIRVDPKKQHQEAVEEIEWGVLRGAMGLKLHPISQGFLSEINTPAVQDVCITALNNRLPIIFDCRYCKTGEDIYQLVQEIQPRVKHKDFTVILGHTCMEYGCSELYDILDHPNIIGDSAGMRGADVALFFSKLKQRHPDTWSSKICFGSDNNYFTIPQALDFISYLFTNEFHETTGGTIQDIQNILGGNLLSRIRIFDQGRVCSAKEGFKGATPSKIDILSDKIWSIPPEASHLDDSSLLSRALKAFGKELGKLDDKNKKRTRGMDYIYPFGGRVITSGSFCVMMADIPDELTEELTGPRIFIYFQTDPGSHNDVQIRDLPHQETPNTDQTDVKQIDSKDAKINGLIYCGTLNFTSGRYSTTPTRSEVYSKIIEKFSNKADHQSSIDTLQENSLIEFFLK